MGLAGKGHLSWVTGEGLGEELRVGESALLQVLLCISAREALERAGCAWKRPDSSFGKVLIPALESPVSFGRQLNHPTPPYTPLQYLVESSFVFKAEGVAAEGELSLGFEALSGS